MTLHDHTIEPHSPASVWRRVAEHVSGWVDQHRLDLRDVVVLVPFAQLLAPARAAFAARGIWMPRIETTRTLAATLGPPPPAAFGAPSGDPRVDAWAAHALLVPRRDWFTPGIDLEAAASEVADLAASIARALHAVPPAARHQRIEQARTLLGPRPGPGADERLLARIALDWAALAAAPTDALWTLQPAGWVAVRAGGVDPMAEAIVAAAAVPTTAIDLDADLDALSVSRAAVVACADFEHEAQDAAAEVIAAIADGLLPVALIAQDRTTTRRIRALLDSRGVAIADETGWRLATTRAAATIGALLDAAEPDASTDATIDALKSLAPWARRPGWTGIESLEGDCRRLRITRRSTLATAPLASAAAATRDAWLGALAPLADAASKPLGAWLDALRAVIEACGAWADWSADAAGDAVAAAIGLDAARGRGRALREVASPGIERHALRRWIDETLEAGSFVPPGPADPEVVILPLERVLLRPFGAAVFPGADERRLGAAPAPWPLIGDAAAAAVGLPDAPARLDARERAFRHLLRLPRLTWLHHRQEGNESIGPSAWIEAAISRGALARAGRRDRRPIEPASVMPSAANAVRLPPLERISATAAESLRDCPYRFFALRLLRLRESDELADDVEPRDFGRWMHDVLLRFHVERGEPEFAEFEVATLQRIAAEERGRSGLPASAFVVHDAAFAAFAPRYIAWLHARDAAGWRFEAGEREVEIRPASFGATAMFGKIDRLDRARSGLELLDYKTGTGATDKLKARLREPFEDTQLAFYAALVADGSEVALAARYLPLEGSKALVPIDHPDVARSAAALVDGLGGELQRVVAGAPLRPLGEGDACEFCAARGLCRRDHWST